MPEKDGKSNRGFASMDDLKQREIASKGGRAAHQKGTAHEFDSDEARAAGRKGGEVVSRNRAHMSEIGRKGGEARGAAARAARSPRATNGAGEEASSHAGTMSAGPPQGRSREGSASVELTDERARRVPGDRPPPVQRPEHARPDQQREGRSGR